MAIKQLSVFVENVEGSLAKVTDALAEENIDIRAMCMADTQEFGIIRMIVDDAPSAKQKLDDKNLFLSVNEVVGIAVSDEPGGLAKAVRVLADNHINIDYMYAFISVSKKNAYVVLRVDDNDAAEMLLSEQGFTIVTDDDVSRI
ncbi:MAG: ACT domain-containing protein [Ruminococcus sp.]|nr:ACT domain-containing protein [Ruminococcus sp.]